MHFTCFVRFTSLFKKRSLWTTDWFRLSWKRWFVWKCMWIRVNYSKKYFKIDLLLKIWKIYIILDFLQVMYLKTLGEPFPNPSISNIFIFLRNSPTLKKNYWEYYYFFLSLKITCYMMHKMDHRCFFCCCNKLDIHQSIVPFLLFV